METKTHICYKQAWYLFYFDKGMVELDATIDATIRKKLGFLKF
jgi:hypothetical protein